MQLDYDQNTAESHLRPPSAPSLLTKVLKQDTKNTLKGLISEIEFDFI